MSDDLHTDSEIKECLEVRHEQLSENVRPDEELVNHLEDGQTHLSMILLQLCHQQVVGVLHIDVRLSASHREKECFY